MKKRNIYEDMVCAASIALIVVTFVTVMINMLPDAVPMVELQRTLNRPK